ncbi:MAG TPA: protein translocase SEC61 complex subunit gamma [Methanoculleus sp.]|jgi:protein transport protein SEC61 subunit gamma and related proteins|uniref:protein translocase SEC61 complex subunit gamma n=1 Tax=Methanoculleus sp. TaxID=90427 RepID=UPI000B08C45A|nr:protein translocase SEC61 complex subunit gamma [Methanoculleus sp.]MBP7145488.1 protein translocase SEC61 complex subunit gamma [Methanoculleus sp.]HNT07827.1 protein translocase SEC61 complex subunit gamma [Methanoculleus sp.]HNV39860.1 protein translocase SEC61 complex subunit gamma [Methanoculleus sp.]HOC83458.1 protein translocase SEC61 complex subunit gamma [Methanoculleus sp.]HOF96996.1 protein translocase SEC61 complex subunit gamma [Methanoculleus sp.]
MMDYKEKFEEVTSFKIEEELFKKYWRVLKLARTPTRDEFSKIAIVAAAGIMLIGLVGFIIYEILLVLPR